MGKATVDIRLPNIEIDVPNIKIRKAGELDSRTRAVRDLLINALARWDRKMRKLLASKSLSACLSSLSAAFSAVVPCNRAKTLPSPSR